MDLELAVSTFEAFSERQQVHFLSRLGHHITILGRDGYEVGGDSLTKPELLRTVNELHHQIFGQQGKLLRGDSKRYPDDTLIQGLYERADYQGYGEELLKCLGSAFEFCARFPMESSE